MQWNTVKSGAKNLLLHKLRSVLTMLGVILGVGSVIAMLAIGEGSKKEALERIKELGANNVIIRSVKPDGGQQDSASATDQAQQASYVLEYGLRYRDLDRLKPDVIPTVDLTVPIAMMVQDARAGDRWLPNTRVLGTNTDYQRVKTVKLARGRFIQLADNENTLNVAVLGAGAARRLFSYEDPLEKDVLLGLDVYRVVGVLAESHAGSRPGDVDQREENNDVIIPLACTQRRFGDVRIVRSTGSRSYERNQLSEITLRVKDENLVSETAAMARKLLEETHADSEDYRVIVPLELLARAEEEKRLWSLVLGSIAGISLVVGGIGIMNIMLASVTERTREIGIRRALGARRRDITVQFLVETVLLSTTGGVLGVLLGIAIPVAVSHFADIDTVISWWSVLVAFLISVGVGIIFGIYPANRAAKMNPIEALRHLN